MGRLDDYIKQMRALSYGDKIYEPTDTMSIQTYRNKYWSDPIFRYREKEKAYQRRNPVKHYTIPYIEDKAVTLTNAGRATGARLSTNLFDTLAINAGRANVPINVAIGLATKESTLGNPTVDETDRAILQGYKRSELLKPGDIGYEPPTQHINRGEDVNPSRLVSYGYNRNNPYKAMLDYVDAIGNKRYVNSYDILSAEEKRVDKQAKINANKPHKNLLQEAFEYYNSNPNKYNPGQKNYPALVEKVAREVMNSPQYKQWWNSGGKTMYNKGKNERRSLENNGR